jgi:nucleoside-diphosphate-sugar epimerase
MIAAITGGTGFVGAALIRHLRSSGKCTEIRVLTRQASAAQGARVFRGDLRYDRLEPFLDGADVLFHCAAELTREADMREVNVGGTQRLIAAAAGRISRWVQLSSVGVYGRSLSEGVVDEGSPLAPDGTYEVTKAQADELLAAVPGCVIVRPSIVFGPEMPNRSLYQLVDAVHKGVFFFVGRDAIANYVYVDDVADALIACACAAGARGTYIVSDDRPLEEFIGTIARELGRKPPRLRVPEPAARFAAKAAQHLPGVPLTPSRVAALARKVAYPSTRIRSELGFTFRVSVEEGLRRLIADWRGEP